MKPESILYVEDDENDVFLLERAFRLEGVQRVFRVARDGQEAMDYLAGDGEFADRPKPPLPALVLLDIKVPKIDGLQVLRWVRGQRWLRTLPVIMFSSSYLPKDIGEAYHLGANCFLVKPSDVEELRQIARFIVSWMRHSQPPPADERDWVALTAQDLQSRRRSG